MAEPGPDICRVIISADQISERVAQLGRQIADDYHGQPLTIILISNGAVIFGADLVRAIDIPLQLDTLSVSSYAGTQSTNVVKVLSELRIDVTNRRVIVVDDILDTGLTLSTIVAQLQTLVPVDVRTCVLLHKQCRRTIAISPDYAGFDVEDCFVVGYGLDHNEMYRNLPYIGELGQSE